jgi:hypothetical protein
MFTPVVRVSRWDLVVWLPLELQPDARLRFVRRWILRSCSSLLDEH